MGTRKEAEAAKLRKSIAADSRRLVDLEDEIRADDERPKPVLNPHLTALVATIEGYLNELEGPDGVDDDTEHYIFEEAVKALYGPEIFQWINKHLQ